MAVTAGAHAQRPLPRPVISVSGGPTPHVFNRSFRAPDDIGTSEGTGFVGALRFDLYVSRVTIIEPAVGLYFYRPADGGERQIMLLDCGVHAGWPRGAVRPFAGVGVGTATPAEGAVLVSAHAVSGVRFGIGGPWSGRAELRWRTIQYLGTAREYTIGLGLRL